MARRTRPRTAADWRRIEIISKWIGVLSWLVAIVAAFLGFLWIAFALLLGFAATDLVTGVALRKGRAAFKAELRAGLEGTADRRGGRR